MHIQTDLKVLYFGTPVVLISTKNEDGTANVAPFSSAWWLGQTCVLGLGNAGQTALNLGRERECVVNLPSSAMVGAVDRLAMFTGRSPVPPRKAAQGYRHEPDKFAMAGLTPQPSELVAAPRVEECPIQLECRLVATHPIGGADSRGSTHHVEVVRAHVEQSLLLPDSNYIDPVGWDPLIMKFCEFFGGGVNLHPSTLAGGWNMPHQTAGPAAGGAQASSTGSGGTSPVRQRLSTPASPIG